MKSWGFGGGRVVAVSAVTAHVLAWAAFLWLILWPWYGSVSATPVGVDGTSVADTEIVREYNSLVEVNGYVVLIPVFFPVLVTGLALLFLLTWKVGQTGSKFVPWSLAVILLAFCGLSYLSIGVFYLPAALALIVTALARSRNTI